MSPAAGNIEVEPGRAPPVLLHLDELARPPLTSYDVALNLISSTTTRTGLTVTARLDTSSYPTGIEISQQHAAALTIHPDAFHGEWNYTIPPQPGIPDVPLHPPGPRSHPRHAHTFGATLATHPS
ncbi:hypothetical protein SHKM778_32140 [Streptomyces sp. KM77-8]|uniref:Uncharacterized protein n=1 Tax=Streptomyces haneummycinicus TaxID=3074435 RepID=A0AAT9HHC7_9ACTN